jgi:hypothetical protein
MKPVYIIILILSLFAQGCKKENKPQLSGTVTIDNILYGTGPYYAMGFSVPTGKKVSTLDDPLDVITILADGDLNNNVRKIYFATVGLKDSYSKFGQYADAAAALQAFNNLTSFTNPQWTETGDSVKADQIWLFRTSMDKYAKIRVISTVAEKRNDKAYAECSLEWVYQPYGSQTFPDR